MMKIFDEDACNLNKMFDSCPSKLDGEVLPLRFEFWPK